MLKDFWITIGTIVMKIQAHSETEAYRIARDRVYGNERC